MRQTALTPNLYFITITIGHPPPPPSAFLTVDLEGIDRDTTIEVSGGGNRERQDLALSLWDNKLLSLV